MIIIIPYKIYVNKKEKYGSQMSYINMCCCYWSSSDYHNSLNIINNFKFIHVQSYGENIIHKNEIYCKIPK